MRHYTATGYVVWDQSVLLHWHKKINLWLPPGGHVEPNEDPVEAVLREIFEETGLASKISKNSNTPTLTFDYPEIIEPPRHILIENIDDPDDGHHQHIDMIYYCYPTDGIMDLLPGWSFFSYEVLKTALKSHQLEKTHLNPSIYPPLDVLALGVDAIDQTV
ncbi:MAG: NUDIX domain-containing protein [SAR202 cluster bacterium]|jgi:8-oxo-dGTP pyrophosphatase MutT (NUDIX family)|nr:NUDIX domain-containing protein [SAR202 cluster bacterium]HJO60034.1 NUDIX domain-containing protein [SAR202 cluster bacterium]|tara:strand:- start:24690 stop:25172 length:483 start_codon:yes stop_codon:yes gene_type:complete